MGNVKAADVTSPESVKSRDSLNSANMMANAAANAGVSAVTAPAANTIAAPAAPAAVVQLVEQPVVHTGSGSTLVNPNNVSSENANALHSKIATWFPEYAG